MVKKNIYNVIVCLLLAIYTLVYRFFVYPKFMAYSESISASFIILLFGLSLIFYGFRKYSNSYLSKKAIKTVLFSVAIYFIFTYAIGLFCGFLNNSYSLRITSIFNNAIFPFIIIIFSELLRYVFIKNNKNSVVFISIISILLFLFDINFYIRFNTFSTIDMGFEFITVQLIPHLIEGVLFSYLCYHCDYKANIIYRLLIELYVYIVPVQPDLNPLVESIINVVLPFSILLSSIGASATNEKRVVKKRLISVADIPFALAAIALVCTIYGFGPYKMLGIETGSMMPNYNIGDAVIIDKNFDPDKLKVGDVIAYENADNIIIIHRIVKINSDKSFITKGDNNNVADSFYVNKDKIKGCVKVKIPWIAYPALLFK